MSSVPEIRIRSVNSGSVRSQAAYVVYWMTSNRRLRFNFSLQRAVEWCQKLDKPLVILEPLRCDYRWASVRLHSFVLQGMSDQEAAWKPNGVFYYPWVEPARGAGRGLLQSLSKDAAVVVTDDFPCFFIPRMLAGAARTLSVLLEAVDSNGLLPLRAASQVFPTAYAFRRLLQASLPPHLSQLPDADPMERFPSCGAPVISPEVLSRWPIADPKLLRADTAALSCLPIEAEPGVSCLHGGALAAEARLKEFLSRRLERYADDRNQPDQDPSSGLSPYLHFGHISVHEVFHELIQQQSWSLDHLSDVRTTRGSRAGWWGMSPSAESFLDELVTWRELGLNMCWQTDNYDQYESLPPWAKKTLAEHAHDVRPYIYSIDQLQRAETHDPIWNAAQRELVTDGRMHNYLRMLWGKKILEWSPSPREALDVMIELNNRYAVDGRDPNSYSGIFWVLGRYDRAWGPERPIFGKIRYMTSDSTARKLKLTDYLRKFGQFND
jgi:deoxyribodipyrimidine photo-lyase